MNWNHLEEEKQKQEYNSLRHIPDSFKKIVIVGGTAKPWRNDDGYVITDNMNFHGYVNTDPEKIESKNIRDIAEKINTSDDIKSFNIIYSTSSFALLFIVLSITTMIVIIVFEKYNGLLIDGLIVSGSSILIYYIVATMYTEVLSKMHYIDVNSKVLNDNIRGIISTMCGVLFVVGIIMLVIYVIKYSDKLLRDFRLKYIYK